MEIESCAVIVTEPLPRAASAVRLCVAAILGVLAAGMASPQDAAHAAEAHAIAMHGAPALAPGFTHFRYVNPAAPKGGRLVEGVLGTFDSLNPLIVRGLAVQRMRGQVIESLMTRGYDEPFTLYGLLAKSVDTDADRTFVSFRLDPAARFSDGQPVTADDVVFSWALLRDKGRPNYRSYYSKVTRADIPEPGVVRFDIHEARDRELPLILALMPVLARHATDPEKFEDTSYAPLVGSGPYVVAEVKPGVSVTMRRKPDYWGRDLAVNRGLWNFDEIRFDYYRDANSHFEAFKKGLYDVRAETDSGRWESAYDIPAVRDKRIVKDEIPNGLPKGMSGLVFNTRRPVFADIRVREAVGLLFNFEWVNNGFFFDRYKRTGSYFEGSELSARGRPADATERALLASFPGAVRADVMAGTWAPAVNDAAGRDRTSLRRALALFGEAGFGLDKGVLRDRKTGKPFSFEMLVTTKDQERLALSFARDMKRAGIEARTRVVDAVQYEQRRQVYDFDMIQYFWDESLSPGNEQSFYWGSAVADAPGSRNYMGVKNPAIDAAIAAMLSARERPEFVSAVRALDRVLISGFYVVPLFHLPDQWVARWAYIRRPAETSVSGALNETWWRQPQSP